MSTLKPVGVFWDIENCCVPKGKSALKIIERIREHFFVDCREAEFICVCDINKEAETTIKDLNDGQINVVHINATAKNAADDKIRQSLRRFSDSHQVGTKVVLISSDVNFASDLSDLRHRKKFHVVLVHKAQVSDALISCANESCLYEDLVKDLPDRPGLKDVTDNLLVVHGYSKDVPLDKVRHLLKMISNNCGGKVVSIGPLFAILKFDTLELMDRAKKRMNGEDVYGRKITVCLPEETPFQNSVRKLSINHMTKRNESPSPNRKPGRQRLNSRTYTPERDDVGGGGGGGASVKGINPHYDPTHNTHYYIDQYYAKQNNPQNADKTTSGVQGHFANFHKSAGGPLSSSNSQREDVQPAIPTNQPIGGGSPESNFHTLPNSKSERFYIKSAVADISKDMENISLTSNQPAATLSNSSTLTGGGGGGNTYEISDLRQPGKAGKSIVVFKPSVQSLKDIPTPSFGFRDMPPPSLPNMASKHPTQQQGKSLDPIKLIEAASRDKAVYGQQQAGNIMPQPIKPMEDQKQANTTTSNSSPMKTAIDLHHLIKSSSSNASIQPINVLKNPTGGQQQHQQKQHPRSASAGLIQTSSIFGGPSSSSFQGHNQGQSTDDKICMAHGYPPASSTSASNQADTQTSSQCFKRPSTPKKGGKHQSQSPNRGFNTNTTKPRAGSGGNAVGPSGSFKPRSSSVSPIFGVPNLNTTSNHHHHQRPPSPFGTIPSSINQSHRSSKPPGCHLYRVPTPDVIDPEMDFLCPGFNVARDPYVELIVSNLDYNIHAREWRKILYATFQPHVKVLSIEIRLQADNTCVATIRLPTEQDARFAISQFHRRKIGYKRISVQFRSDSSQSPADTLRMDTISLLMEAKDQKLALSRIIDLFDQRFHKAVSVSDIYKMRDIIQIQEISGAGRWVKLQPGVKRTTTPVTANDSEMADTFEQPVCPIHCQEGTSFYTEALNSCMLPNVIVMRKHFSPQLHSLLLSHNGYVPLMSFPACYSAEFYPLKPSKDGIPLEHVIASVPGVEIMVSKAGVKVIQFQENKEHFNDMMKGTSWQELGKISREVMDLLRQQAACSMPVSKFIPSYHHYFGRQCRVADYGYTKLQELFEAIPHAIQILGTGDRKVITLSPRAQLKRFTTDIIKVVKMQPAKQIMLQEFAHCFEKVMGNPLYLPHYGVSYIEDVLSEIPTTTLIVIEEGKHTLLAVPRRDQTPEEVERTKQFALEVVDLLKHHPQCRMAFNKFIPAYHHHFGRQCRVASYGFNKLTDLFEAISHVIELEEEGEERLLHLTAPELRKVLCEQLSVLIRPVGYIPVHKLLAEFGRHFGFGLRLEDFGVDSVHGLVDKMRSHLKLETRNGVECLCLVQEVYIPVLGLQVMQLLMDESGGSLPLMELSMRYESLFGKSCDVRQIREELQDFVQIDDTDGGDSGGNIRLTSHQLLGRNLRLLLLHHQQIAMCDLTTMYRQQFGVELSPALYGFQTLYQLLHSFPHILQVRGKPTQKYLVLSGMLATPGILPPARVDVTSPNSFGSHPASNSNSQGEKPSLSSSSQPNQTTTTTSSSLHPPPPSSHHATPSPTLTPLSSSSQLLQQASLLWDPAIVQQSPAISSFPSDSQMVSSSMRILDQLNITSSTKNSNSTNSNAATTNKSSTGNIALSVSELLKASAVNSCVGSGGSVAVPGSGGDASQSNNSAGSSHANGGVPLTSSGVPASWQMKLFKNMNSSEVITSGNLAGGSSPSLSIATTTTEASSTGKDQEKIGTDLTSSSSFPSSPLSTSATTNTASPHTDSGAGGNVSLSKLLMVKSADDSFLSGEPPLDTSSTHSQLNSSSQSSTGSPIKRKPRIAANFFSQAQ